MTDLTRRTFLEDSLFAAAAAALASQPLIRPSVLYGDESSDVLRVAVVGLNGRGTAHIGQFGNRKDCVVAAVVDPDELIANKRADEIQASKGKRPAVYADLRQCFDDKSIDIVSIATPNHWHALAAIWAVQAGKDVYVEKPVSHNVSEGRRIVEAGRKYKRVVQTGTQSRSNTGMREAIEFLHQGGIGEVKLARGLCYNRRASIGSKGSYEVPASVNYDLWAGPAPMAKVTRPKFHYDWHWQWACGNGDLGNQGIHQMDIARWGLQEISLGKTVRSYGGRFQWNDAGETPNSQVCIHEFADGKRLVFEVRGLETEKLDGAGVGVIFYGSEGKLVIPTYNGGVVYDNDGKEVKKFNGGDDSLHYDNFVQAVRHRDASRLNAEILEGHLSSALCHLGNISYRLGSMLPSDEIQKVFAADREASSTLEHFLGYMANNDVDPRATQMILGPELTLTEDETFTGDHADEANPLLTREYRQPYVVPSSTDV
ncbi:MAG: Gfo/Idh/MocA family oxidoreductase [Planctomycetota bacterium]|nr:Gfo/Idh/MocA family oxidoreductase [Planctomycetota bacterium]